MKWIIRLLRALFPTALYVATVCVLLGLNVKLWVVNDWSKSLSEDPMENWIALGIVAILLNQLGRAPKVNIQRQIFSKN